MIDRKFYTLKSVDNGQTTERNGKDSNILRMALRVAARQGLEAMAELYDKKEPNLINKGIFLPTNHPGAMLSQFSSPITDEAQNSSRAAYAALFAAKQLKHNLNIDFSERSRETPPKISLRRTSLEAFCPPREQPFCSPISRRYRTYDGTCNNARKGRWGAAQLPFNRFQSPAYSDGIEEMRQSVLGGPLPSPRFISLLVHGSRESEAPVTLMLAQWGQFIDHDLTATLQPRSVNGSVPQCCGVSELHPSCAPIRVPTDDPWLAPFGIRCLEFLRSAAAQRRDCLLSWREQTNQVTSFLDASTIYASSERSAERSRLFSNGLLVYGRGPPRDDVCLRGAFDNQCIRAGDTRSGEQPGLLAMHHTWVLEHNRIATVLSDMNLHWSDEKIYQETRRIVGAMVQHITYREFLPLVLGREVCKLFELELQSAGYYTEYDARINPTLANSFAAAAFRFGHSLIQNTYMRSTRNHEFLDNNVTLHEESFRGDIGSPGSLHRLLRGLSIQRAQKRDEFITAELTNHLFQSGSFPFGLDLAAINIQRGRDHGLPAYTQWREPCGLTPIIDWNDLERVVGPNSAQRMRRAYKSVDDIDLFVGGLAERPVVGGLVGPVFACIIAQQFSNLRKGDRFWYENGDFESSFTPAQLQSIRQVNLAQVICDILGSGTLQPHIFLPHTVSTNERIPCGTGSLIPIDLRPWLERDPFLKNVQRFNDSTTTANGNDGRSTEVPIIQTIDDKIIIHLSSLPQQNPINIQNSNDELFSVNATIVNNKIDLDTTRSHFNNDRLTNDSTNKINTGRKTQPKKSKPKRTATKTGSSTTSTTTTTTTTTTTVTLTKRKPTQKRTKKRTNKNSNRTRRKHKRDINDDNNDDNDANANTEKGRSSIVIKIDKDSEDGNTAKSPFNHKNDKRRIDKNSAPRLPNKEYVILTPDQNAYDIEIKIKQKKPQTNEKLVIDTNNAANSHYNKNKIPATKRPLQFYQVAQPSLSDDGLYNSMQNDFVKPQTPADTYVTYQPIIIVKRTTTIKHPITTTSRPSIITSRRPYIYNTQNDQPTVKPYYTTKRPFNGYGSNEPDPIDNDDDDNTNDEPFYSYPTIQNTDTSSYYASTNANDGDNSNYNNHNNNDEYVSIIQNSKPYQTKPSYNKPYLDRPSATNPTNYNYGQFADDAHAHPSYGQSARPPQTNIQNNDYGPTYLDDFVTPSPDKLTTTYIVHSDDDEYDDSIQSGYGTFTTSRPHFDLTTYYSVQTTKKKKKKQTIRTTRPTRPLRPVYGGQNDEDDDTNDENNNNDDENDDDDDDDDDDDNDDDDNIGYFNPTSVLSNIVNTFNGYFGSASSTTTRKPYITQQNNPYDTPQQQDNIDPDNDDNFYTHPSLPAYDFPYTRQRHIEIIKKARTRNARSSDFAHDDFEQYDLTTYRPAHAVENVDFHDDTDNHKTDKDNNDDNDDTKVIAFDRDGYLRPEYMNYFDPQTPNINTNLYFDVNGKVDHKPSDKMTNTTNVRQRQQFVNTQQAHHLLNGRFQNTNTRHRHHKQIHTLTDNDRNHTHAVHHGTVPSTHRPFGLVPLSVLTKPERPDNWVMYDAEHKAPPPRIPQLKLDFEENSDEMPRPIALRRNWSAG